MENNFEYEVWSSGEPWAAFHWFSCAVDYAENFGLPCVIIDGNTGEVLGEYEGR